MAVKTEVNRLGDILKFEAERSFSREQVTFAIDAGAASLAVGTVVGKITKGAATGAAVAGNTGNGTITASPTVDVAAKVGVYRATCIRSATDSGEFLIQDPDGISLGTAVVGTAFTTHLTFTIADGATDFAAGDMFTITVAAGSGEYGALDFDSITGLDAAAGILIEDIDLSASATVESVVVNSFAKVIAANLVWPVGATTNQKNAALAQLAVLGIKAEDSY
jgi:hypothetical protein